jgi:hypothetical protein
MENSVIAIGISLLVLIIVVIMFFVLRNNIKSLKAPVDTVLPQLKEIDEAFQKFKDSIAAKISGK